MGDHATRARLRSVAVGLLTVLLSSVTMTLPASASGSVAPAPGGVSLSGVQVTKSGVPAVLTARLGSRAGIDPVSTAPPSTRGVRPLVVSANPGGKALQGGPVVNLVAQGLPPTSASPAPSPASASGLLSAPTATAPTGVGVSWVLWLALIAVFLGIGGVVATLAMPTYVSRRQRQVESIEGYLSGASSSERDERSAVSSISASLVNLGDKVMDGRTSTPKTQRLLERGDLPLRVGEWAVLRVVAVVVGVSGGILALHGGSVSTLVGSCLGALVGVVGPALFLKLAASRRAKKFEGQLPDVLTLVASSLSTGFSLLQALDAVARDASEPSAKEFSRALAETRIGADLNESLDHLADRMDSSNLRWTGMAISIQRQVGGNLAETLRTTAATLRDRQALRRHVSALSAEGKLSAYILIALPIGVFLYMLGVNKAYVELLWTTTIGIGMLAGGLISLAVGIFWMRKVVTVEV
jgi:tight adherence protein B